MDLKEKMLQDILGQQNVRLSVDQEEALGLFMRFIREEEYRSAFLLTGSAGTGKTFLISIFTKLLRKSGYKVILLAPTGRAAKVISRSAKRAAFTIHHHIYSPMENSYGDISFARKPNKEPGRTVYVVDEASMIGDKSDGATPNGLLDDLLSYAFDNDGSRKLVIVGDPVQLPPVGHKESPALDPDYLYRRLDLDLKHAHLTEVKRQQVDSGVLENAVRIRDAFVAGQPEQLQFETGRDVQVIEQAYEALETYMGYYREGDLERVQFLTYSNWQAVKVNQAIRQQLFFSEEMLVPSELVMVVKNNYAWGDSKRMPFVANGEMGTIRHVDNDTYEERYGLKWVNAEIEFQDVRGEPLVLEGKVVLSLLQEKSPQLASEFRTRVWQERRAEYMGHNPKKAAELLRGDPYLNALEIKYGYAITGHKSQGGQWENVLIGFEPDYGRNPLAYIRWTYTAVTRAQERVFLMNCPFVE